MLDEYIKKDPSFKKSLSEAVEEAGKSPELHTFVTQVMDNAKVGKLTNIGSIHGNATF